MALRRNETGKLVWKTEVHGGRLTSAAVVSALLHFKCMPRKIRSLLPGFLVHLFLLPQHA